MTQLTKDEIEMIEREAGLNATKYSTDTQVKIFTSLVDCYSIAATKYLTQLKGERERASKLLEALGELLNAVESYDGEINNRYISQSVDKAQTAITEYKNKP